MILSLQSVSCERGGRRIFSDVSAAVDTGTALVVTGANGAGKSTLLRVIAGLLSPTSGRIVCSMGEMCDVAHYLGHHDGVKGVLLVREQLGFWNGYHSSSFDRLQMREAFGTLGLASLADMPCGFLSAGQRRRLALARLLLVPRPIWLLDEPTSALDLQGQSLLTKMMRTHLGSGGIIIAATHQPLDLTPCVFLKLGVA